MRSFESEFALHLVNKIQNSRRRLLPTTDLPSSASHARVNRLPTDGVRDGVEVSMECREVSRQALFKALLIPRLIFVLPLECSSAAKGARRGIVRIIAEAKYIKSGETVIDRHTRLMT